MYLKSECTGANDDDFVQDGNTIKELTVTITLAEYRNLIIENTRYEKTVNDLKIRLEKAEKQAQLMRDMVLYDHPEFIGDLSNAVSKFLSRMSKNPPEKREFENEQT